MAQSLTTLSISIASSGDNTVIPGLAGSTVRIEYFELYNNSAVATTVVMKNGTTAINGLGYKLQPDDFMDYKGSDGTTTVAHPRRLDMASGASFVMNLDGANQHSGFVQYRLELDGS